ncbi:uncharacterized protein M421DRAFT_387713 [Didymella exigua CBS 183.55]|uniref:Uncharacterized protein n=1 Tax=Didymella exigua CBS 183.55 TaxID=1150837 RepID=A0A6A5R4A8_9PLEO|nr:uncharacterized protein M421DRAFT_387713 [Didymella exigua CBS 183.55]KAF1922219.1 hypothetical protein M421DRAFT_387713 [Didymella exigua CBS 183.55]
MFCPRSSQLWGKRTCPSGTTCYNRISCDLSHVVTVCPCKTYAPTVLKTSQTNSAFIDPLMGDMARFQIPDFTVPGAYFSPLTSPVLNTHSQSATGHSPINVYIDLLGKPDTAQPAEHRRFRTKKDLTGTIPTDCVQKSPIVNPGRRKNTISMQPKAPYRISATDLAESAVTNLAPRMSGEMISLQPAVPSHSVDVLSSESASSSDLSQRLGSHSSPSFSRQHLVAQSNQGATPITPASLMRIRSSPH